jgi:ubiquinone/menaquinone biosynthesis C-methylase UbiE
MSSVNYFKEVSSDWDELSTSFFGEAPRKAIYQEIDWEKVKTLADIGCGTGYMSETINRSEIAVIAVDQSSEMLSEMREKLGNENISYRVGDADQLPIKDESVDVVVANMYLHHVENPLIAIEQMYRILRPGGQLVFTDLDTHDYKFLVEEQHDRWMGFDRDQIKSWMRIAGFRDLKTDCVGSDCCASSCSSGDEAKISIFMASGVK